MSEEVKLLPCSLPPAGWACSRGAGHDGPCAATAISADPIEHAFRAGHAAAEEALGAHGSERLLQAIENAWAEYQADNPTPQPAEARGIVEAELRGLVIACGRAAGAYVSDECSHEFLKYIPAEVEAKIAALSATLSPQAGGGEAVAYQTFKDGKWVECSEFVAKGWGDKIADGCRALYTSPPAPADNAGLVARLEGLGRTIAENEGDDPIADNGMTVWHGVQMDAAYLFPRILSALRANGAEQ